VYRKLLAHQREALHRINKQQHVSGEMVRKYLSLLDLEEEKLRMKYEGE
jgi:CPA1 family monovalent cation:H+ antiporter